MQGVSSDNPPNTLVKSWTRRRNGRLCKVGRVPVTGEKEPRARSLALGRWSGGKARGDYRRIKRGLERNNEAQVSRATTAQQIHLLPSLEEVRPRGNDCLLIGGVALGRPWGGYIGTRVGGSPAAVPVRSAFGRDYIPDHRQSLSGPLHSICTAALSYLFPSKSRPRPPTALSLVEQQLVNNHLNLQPPWHDPHTSWGHCPA